MFFLFREQIGRGTDREYNAKGRFFDGKQVFFFSCATRIPQTSYGIRWWSGKAPGTATQATSRGSLRAAGDARNRFRSRFAAF